MLNSSLPSAETVQIRVARPADISAIVRIDEESETAAHWNPRAYEALFSPQASPRRTLIATDDSRGQQILGFIVAHSLAAEWELENLVVAAARRREGVGSKLLAELLRDLEAAGAHSVLLEVRETNLAARRLYEKHGFKQQGRRAGYYRNPAEDALVLRRLLQLCDNTLEAE